MVITEVVKGREKEKKTFIQSRSYGADCSKAQQDSCMWQDKGGVWGGQLHSPPPGTASSDVPECCSEMLLSAWRHRQSMTQFYNIC